MKKKVYYGVGIVSLLLAVAGARAVDNDGVDKTIYATALYPDVQTVCNDDTDCGPLDCETDDFGPPSAAGKCVRTCDPLSVPPTNDNCATVFGAGWQCFASGQMAGYCFVETPAGVTNPQDLVVYRSGANPAWSAPYGDHLAYRRVKQVLHKVSEFNGKLDIHGRNGAGDPFEVRLVTVCECSANPPCKLHDGCPSGATAEANGPNGPVLLYKWPGYYGAQQVDNWLKYKQLAILMHEFAHLFLAQFYGGSNTQALPETGLQESLPRMFQTLFAMEHIVAARDALFTDSLNNEFRIWMDQKSGRTPPNGSDLPYSQRHMFDWLVPLEWLSEWTGVGCDPNVPSSCQAYEVCDKNPSLNYECRAAWVSNGNFPIWARFLRILMQGPDTFDDDGNGEDIGLAGWSPVGEDTARVILLEAASQVTDATTLAEFVDLLVAAADNYVKKPEAIAALGAVGFLMDDRTIAPGTGRYSPRAIRYRAYAPSDNKRIVVTASDDGRDLHVWRGDGTPSPSYVDMSKPGARPAGRPAAVEFENQLYIFYPRSTGQIRMLTVNPDGDLRVRGPLDSLGLSADGAFDAVVFAGRLYIVFTEHGTGQLQIAYCDGDNGLCYRDPEISWHQFGSGTYKQELPYYAHPGVAAAAGSDVYGMPADEERMFIALAESATDRIKVVVLDIGHIVQMTREIPDRYPSYETTAPMGIEVRRSALPHPVSSDSVNYVYLTWTSDERVFMSVLHNLNDRHRFTRSMDTFRTAHPDTGASFVRGQSVNYHILPVWLNGQQRPYSAHLYGRY